MVSDTMLENLEKSTAVAVLILVVMEGDLISIKVNLKCLQSENLNPYYDGKELPNE